MNSFAIDIAKYLIVVPVICAIYLLWKLDKKNRREYIALLILGGILSVILAKIAGQIYSDPRPFIKDGIVPLFKTGNDNGFPSDHTLFAAYVGFATMFYSRRLGIALLIIAALIGWARVYSGVHHFVDIVGSLVITGISAWTVHWAIKKYNRNQNKQSHAPKQEV